MSKIGCQCPKMEIYGFLTFFAAKACFACRKGAKNAISGTTGCVLQAIFEKEIVCFGLIAGQGGKNTDWKKGFYNQKGDFMLKGCQKEMIVLQTQDSRFFESAYFVLRKEKRATPKGDLLAEANRIIGTGDDFWRARRKLPRGVLLFTLGALTGVLLSVLFCLIF